jgi:hypothetical protein
MQVEVPSEGQTIIPVVWYFAPPGAKTIRGLCAFTSGIWDRDTPAQSPALGEQQPYVGKYYNGVNTWGYLGQCKIGTDENFANGWTAAQLAAPLQPIPACCAPAPPPPPQFACAYYPLGLPSILSVQIFPKPGQPPLPDPSQTLALLAVPHTFGCSYFLEIPTSPTHGYTMAIQFLANEIIAQWGEPPPTGASVQWTVTGRFPAVFRLDLVSDDSTPPSPYTGSYVLIAPYPEVFTVQPIVLAGDVNGTGDLTPGGALIATALAPIIAAQTVGDAGHYPIVTVDATGRITGITPQAVSGGGLTIGDAISGGIPYDVLIVDPSGNLGQDDTFQISTYYVFFTQKQLQINNTLIPCVELSDGTNGVALCNLAAAAFFSSGALNLWICDGVNYITYTPVTSANWTGTPPTDLVVAVDRLAQWMATNFPLLTPP